MNNNFTLIDDNTEKAITISTFGVVVFCMVFVCALSCFLFDIQNSLKIIKKRLQVGHQIPYASIHMHTPHEREHDML